MGDARFEKHLERVLSNGPDTLGELSDDELVQALAALAARRGGREAYLGNIIASEMMNRMARMHSAVLQSFDGLLAVDLDGAVVFANPAAEALLGWTQRELRGVHIHTLIHPEDEGGGCSLEGSLESGDSTVRDRSVFTRKDGNKVQVDFSIAPLKREGDRYGAVLAFHSSPTGPERSTIA